MRCPGIRHCAAGDGNVLRPGAAHGGGRERAAGGRYRHGRGRGNGQRYYGVRRGAGAVAGIVGKTVVAAIPGQRRVRNRRPGNHQRAVLRRANQIHRRRGAAGERERNGVILTVGRHLCANVARHGRLLVALDSKAVVFRGAIFGGHDDREGIYAHAQVDRGRCGAGRHNAAVHGDSGSGMGGDRRQRHRGDRVIDRRVVAGVTGREAGRERAAGKREPAQRGI